MHRKLISILLLAIFPFIQILSQSSSTPGIPCNTAKNGFKALKGSRDYYLFCESCGDEKAKLMQISSMSFGGNTKDGCSIFINDKKIDINITYVKIKDKWKNLAHFLKFNPDATPEELQEKHFPRDIAKENTIKKSDIDYLSVLEKEVIDEVNLARTEPKKYAEFIEAMKPFFKGTLFQEPDKIAIQTNEGVKAVDEAVKFLKSQEALSALTPSKGLSLASKDHVKDTGPKGVVGHTGTDGSNPFQRISRYGTNKGYSGENISYGFNTARAIVIQLIVDDGVASRGHRKNIFSPNFKTIGAGYGTHTQYGHMCVQNFGGDFTETK